MTIAGEPNQRSRVPPALLHLDHCTAGLQPTTAGFLLPRRCPPQDGLACKSHVADHTRPALTDGAAP